jgi:hypothetical protein
MEKSGILMTLYKIHIGIQVLKDISISNESVTAIQNRKKIQL